MKKEWNEEQFKAWKDKVNNYIIRKTGLSADDLPDFCYADYFERGETPSATARAAIENAGEF